MKGEIFNFVLFSDIGTGTVADKIFYIDWNVLPESRYKLTFSFVSSTLAVATTYEAMLFINEIGCSNNIICFAPSDYFFFQIFYWIFFLFQSSAQSRSQFREVEYKSFYGCNLIPYSNNLENLSIEIIPYR